MNDDENANTSAMMSLVELSARALALVEVQKAERIGLLMSTNKDTRKWAPKFQVQSEGLPSIYGMLEPLAVTKLKCVCLGVFSVGRGWRE